MKSKKLTAIIAVVFVVCTLGYIAARNTNHDSHGPDCTEHSEAPDNQAETEGLDEHEDEEQAIELTADEIREIGLETAIASAGSVDIHISLPGEIKVNQDRMAHIVPVVPGIVRQISKKLGDPVQAGEVIAWLESSDLGKAKMDYLGKWAEMTCCALDLTRAQQIQDNTIKLLGILADSPSLETLQNANGIEMGDNLSKLISTYAEYSFAKAAYQREKPLFEQKITSEEDFLKAQNAFKKAYAQYTATRDSISFEVKRNLLEANRTRQLQSMELKNAERQLKILGLTDENIKELELLAENQISASAPESDCDNPDCTECVRIKDAANKSIAALKKAEEKLAWYPLAAPFDGTIIEKHIVLGELAGTESVVYIVADLSSVWVDLQVYPKDLKHIKKGQKVVISADSEIPDASGIISYVGPTVGAESRTAIARAVLANESGVFRPGLFITARTVVSTTQAKVVVHKDTIQSLEGRKCVFTKDDHGFEPAFVEIGAANTSHAEILSGLTAGQEYVTKGAFALKSKIVTSTLDSHAGHGH
jgi:RND family efflux transporter MFP subunit